MNRKDLIDKAARYLRSKGYLIGSILPNRCIDIVAFGEDKNKPIFVSVGDASKVKSIPMNGFGFSKRAKERAARFVDSAKTWVDVYCFVKKYEFDSVWVDGDACHHMVNIRPCGNS